MSDKPSLLPSNSTLLERTLEQALSRDMPVAIDGLWNPDTCPSALLPWLAWSLSLDDWRPYWPDEVKRERIRRAVSIQRKKGTSKSVRDLVQSFGSSLRATEWWQMQPKGVPHTFIVELDVSGMIGGEPTTVEYQKDIVDAITRAKPVRSHFDFVVGSTAASGLGLNAVLFGTTYKYLEAKEANYSGGTGFKGIFYGSNHVNLHANTLTEG